MVGLPISVSMAFISLLHPYALGPYEHIRNISVGPRIRSVFNSQLGLPTLKSSSVARASLLQAAKGDKEPLADAGLKPPGRSSSSTTRVEKRYPFEGYQKPLERRWDGFWREAVSVPPGCSRRHIVMVNVFKQSILSMRAWAIEQDAVDALREVYRTLINEHYTIQLGTHCTLTYLEAALFFALHNLRFNIFIGSSIWNQLNNNVGARVDAVTGKLVKQLEASESAHDMVAQLKVWHAEYVCGERGGRSGGADDASRQAYAEHRLWIEAAVLEIIVPTHLDRPLEVIRQDIMERVAAISDALATDISCAQYAPLRRWQNTVLIPLQAEFMALKEQPDLERYKHALRQFLQTDEGGAAILNIELEQLRQYTEYPEGVAEFVEAITEPVPD